MDIGKALQLVRIQRELSQRTVAETVGMTVQYLSLLETNKREPSLSALRKLAACYSTPLWQIVALAESALRDQALALLAVLLASPAAPIRAEIAEVVEAVEDAEDTP